MALFLDYLDNGMKKLAGKNTRIRFIGDFSVFDDVFRAKMKKVEADTAKNSQLVVNVAINYGGRQEICQAAKKAASMVKNHKLTPEDIDDKLLSSLMYEADYPDPDLIIRPSGEKRLSNFLLWQSAYSEFWFSNILWPDFKKKHLVEAILDYQKRNRRYGGV